VNINFLIFKYYTMANLFFIVAGLENGYIPFTAKFTLSDLLSNTGKYADTEMFYSLNDLNEEKFNDLCKLDYVPIEIEINRDNPNSKALIVKVSQEKYLKTTIYENESIN